MEAIVCLDCGYAVGSYYEAFVYMKEVLLSKSTKSLQVSAVHVDKKIIDPEVDENLIPIFNALKIKKYCCRGQLTTCRNMHDIGY